MIGGTLLNLAIASSRASIYQDCVGKVGQSGIEVLTYIWLLLQFWPCSRTAANMLHYMGRFKVRRMIQARLFRKNNPDAHYCNTIYNFMKHRAIKHRTDSTFFSVDAKCQLSVGKPDFLPRLKKLWLE